MGFRNGCYAKVWKIERPEGKKYASVSLSVSRKRREGEGYETIFSDYVMFTGNALQSIDQLHTGDRIRLMDVDVNNAYKKDTKEKRYFFFVSEWEPADSRANQSPTDPAPTDDGDIPF